MRLVFVLEHFHPFVGGVSTLFEELAKQLVLRGHKVTVITTRVPGTAKEEEWHGMQIHRVWTPPISRRYWFTLLAIPVVWHYAAGADVIQTTTYNAAIPSWLVGRLRHKPVVITVHEVWGKRWLNYPISKPLARLYQFIERSIVRLSYARLVAVSKATAADLIRERESKAGIQVIYNGIDTVLFDGKKYHHAQERSRYPKNGTAFLYFGRPGVSKGVEPLIDAFVQVSPKIDATFTLLLNPDPADRYQAITQQIARSGLRDKIRIIAPVTRDLLPKIIVGADCVVIPSLAEGFGFTAAEACSLGRPIITTSAGSLPEVVFGKVITVPPGDVEALASALSEASRGAFTTVPDKDFSWQRAAESYEQIYQEIV